MAGPRDNKAYTLEELANMPPASAEPAAPPTVPKEETRSTGVWGGVQAASRGALDTLTFGTADEIAARLFSLGRGTPYEEELARQRAIDKFDEEHNGWSRTGGQVAGGVAMAVGGPVLPSARAAGLVGRTLLGGAEAGAAGALHGFGSGEGGVANRLANAGQEGLTGAVIGAPLAAAAPAITRGINAAADAVGVHLPRSVPAGPTPGDEFGVRMTRGQTTGDITQQQLEQDLAAGVRSGGEAHMRDFYNAQRQDLSQAAGGIADRIAGGQAVTRNPQDLAETALQGVTAREQAARAGINDAYEAARAAGITIRPDAVQEAAPRIRQQLIDARVVVNPERSHYTARALEELDEFSGRFGGALNDMLTGPPPPPGEMQGVLLEGIEKQRQSLLKYIDNAPPDQKQELIQVRRAFDDWYNELGDDAIMDGTEQGMQLFRQARATRRQYAQQFESSARQRDDDAGRLIERMVSKDVTSTEVANAIWGAARVGENPTAVRLVRRLEGILGRESPDFQAIRQGAWERLIQGQRTQGEGTGMLGPEAAANRITDFLTRDGRAAAQALFSDEERQLMRRYADVLRRTVPPKGVVNYSNTAQALNRAGEGMLARIMAGLGFNAGGIPGAVAGAVAGGGINATGRAINWNRAVQATRPQTPEIRGLQRVVPGLGIGASTVAEDENLPVQINGRR